MPAIIDHEHRRRELAQIVADIIVTSGLNAVTVRSVAAAAGFSTAVVSHYFQSKRDLLFYSYRRAEARATERLQAAAAQGGDALRILECLLPLTPEARRDWMVWAVFWGEALADPELSAEQRSQFRKARRRFERLIAGSLRAAGTRRTRRVQEDARRVLTVLIGLVVQAAFDPEDWPAHRQRAYLSEALGLARRD
jgi:TetR/AcrR family transcriptional repressor of bet genes